jgi:hypothetical protein
MAIDRQDSVDKLQDEQITEVASNATSSQASDLQRTL